MGSLSTEPTCTSTAPLVYCAGTVFLTIVANGHVDQAHSCQNAVVKKVYTLCQNPRSNRDFTFPSADRCSENNFRIISRKSRESSAAEGEREMERELVKWNGAANLIIQTYLNRNNNCVSMAQES